MINAFPVVANADCIGVLEPRFKCEPLGAAAVRAALEEARFDDGSIRPVASAIRPGEKVCIVVSDHTRKTASDLVLPVLLDCLKARGCSPQDFFILIASGIHRHPAGAEIQRILGQEVAAAFAGRIHLHDPDDSSCLAPVGRMQDGHEVVINRLAVEADRLVLTGAASFHYHAGFGGGRKAIVPGIASRATIAYNHSLAIDPVLNRLRPGVEIGRMEGNAVSESMLAGARLLPPAFIVNTVIAASGALAGVFAGGMEAAHNAACRMVEKIGRIDIARKADLVFASAGNASNWIQAHKALFNAHRAVHEKGRVILDAACPEGLGNERFRHWVEMRSLDEMFAGLRRAHEVNGQTALSTRERAPRTILVTRMNDRDARALGIRRASGMDEAAAMALADLAREGISRPAYYTMPDAMSVVPFPASTAAGET